MDPITMMVVLAALAYLFLRLLRYEPTATTIRDKTADDEAQVPAATTRRTINTTTTSIPESVNYHFTRVCNYSCGFCFHTEKTSFVLMLQEAKAGLSLLAEAGMRKINFSGGEPFLHRGGRFLGEMVRYCKEDLGVESVTVVTNGSKVTHEWMEEYGYYLDIMAVSCDSFNEATNAKIGRRAQGKNDHLEIVSRVRGWCADFNVLFKLNTVVNAFNKDDDMVSQVRALDPIRWKVFQCLAIEAENIGPNAKRQVQPYLVTKDEFQAFLDRHASVQQLVPESNEDMRDSYLILDEYMRFLDNTGGGKRPSRSILDVGVAHALQFSGFDEAAFLKRGGRYKWSKKDQELEW